MMDRNFLNIAMIKTLQILQSSGAARVKSRVNFIGSRFAPPNRMETEEPIRVNCGRCGRPLLMTIEKLRDLRTVDCPDCTRIRHQDESRNRGESHSRLFSLSTRQRVLRLPKAARRSS
jgi:hypothetical protein